MFYLLKASVKCTPSLIQSLNPNEVCCPVKVPLKNHQNCCTCNDSYSTNIKKQGSYEYQVLRGF